MPDVFLSDHLHKRPQWLPRLQGSAVDPATIGSAASTGAKSMQIRYRRTFRKHSFSDFECMPNELIEAICFQMCDQGSSDREILENRRTYSANVPSLARLSLASRRLHKILNPMLYWFVCQVEPAPFSQITYWETRVLDSLSLPKPQSRFQHTRLLDAGGLLDFIIRGYTSALPNLRSIRVSNMSWVDWRIVQHSHQTGPRIEGMILEEPATFVMYADVRLVDLQWAVFGASTTPVVPKRPTSGLHTIREVYFKGYRLDMPRCIMETLQTSQIRKLELGVFSENDFTAFWQDLELTGLESLILTLLDDITSCSCLQGRLPPIHLELVRPSQTHGWEDPVYLTLPVNIRRLCPAFRAIKLKDDHLRIALLERFPDLEQIVVPSPPAAGRSSLLSARDYIEGIEWLREVCKEREKPLQIVWYGIGRDQ